MSLTSLVGREREIGDLDGLLAAELALRIDWRRADSVAWVDLAPLTDPYAVVHHTARSLALCRASIEAIMGRRRPAGWPGGVPPPASQRGGDARAPAGEDANAPHDETKPWHNLPLPCAPIDFSASATSPKERSCRRARDSSKDITTPRPAPTGAGLFASQEER